MNKIIFICVLILFIIFISLLLITTKHSKGLISPYNSQHVLVSSQPTPEIESKTVSYNESTYEYDFFYVAKPTDMILIPNFSEKQSSQEIASANGCIQGINGGFYTKDNKPLGGFMTGMNILRNPVKNRLIDGFIWSEGTSFYITLSEPSSHAQFFLQAGPLLKIKGESTNISISNDEQKRRHVASLSNDGSLVFFTIFNPESVYEGPFLTDLPVIMSLIEQDTNLHLKDIINLDGGSASAYISKEKILQEFSPIGSFFCIQK